MNAVPLGREAEALAAAHLERLGLTILARNLRTPAGELDLVAREGRTLVFVEVKARSGEAFGAPEEAVDTAKQARLIQAARAYLALQGGPPPPCRFDVVAVDFTEGAPRMRHLRDAFRP